MFDASIIIVSYNSATTIADCLQSLAAQQSHNFEVIVVDNASSDATLAKIRADAIKNLKLIKLDHNLGFNGGNMAGVHKARGRVLIFLNPDTIVPPDFVDRISADLDQDRVAVIGCGVRYPNGKLQLCGSTLPTFRSLIYEFSSYQKLFPRSHSYQKFMIAGWDRRSSRVIDAVPGACFALLRTTFDKIGGFDTNYFLFYEEYDLAESIKRLGQQIFFDSSLVITHVTGASTAKVKPAIIEQMFMNSRDYYLRKHHGWLYFWSFKAACRGFDLTWSGLRRLRILRARY